MVHCIKYFHSTEKFNHLWSIHEKVGDFPIKQKVATTTKHPQTAIILQKMGQSLWFTCYFSWFYNIMGFRLKTKKVYFSGLKNIAVHVTVRLASLCTMATFLLHKSWIFRLASWLLCCLTKKKNPFELILIALNKKHKRAAIYRKKERHATVIKSIIFEVQAKGFFWGHLSSLALFTWV